jgi:hypothetical protein
MDPSRVARMEHLALETRLALTTLCERVRQEFALPEFQFDHENDTEWGWSELDAIEYNVSRPYRRETLGGWDSSVPAGCNVAICLTLSTAHPRCDDEEWILGSLVASVGSRLHDVMGAPVHHHRTWLKAGNVSRSTVFSG